MNNTDIISHLWIFKVILSIKIMLYEKSAQICELGLKKSESSSKSRFKGQSESLKILVGDKLRKNNDKCQTG